MFEMGTNMTGTVYMKVTSTELGEWEGSDNIVNGSLSSPTSWSRPGAEMYLIIPQQNLSGSMVIADVKLSIRAIEDIHGKSISKAAVLFNDYWVDASEVQYISGALIGKEAKNYKFRMKAYEFGINLDIEYTLNSTWT